MDVLQTLESNVNQWADAISERKERAETLRAECDRLVSESIDLSEPKAKQARTKRAEDLAELELIGAQLQELTRRRDVAAQAIREYQLSQAQEAYTKAEQEAREKRLALNALYDDRLHFMNRGGRLAESEASIFEKRDIEVKIATAQAELTIANRKAAETGAALRALKEN